MKVVYALRVRDEEKIIRRAIEAHDWVDLIVVCDGGSIDKTVKIAQEYPNVLITHFDEKYYRADGSWRNPEGRQINHTLSVAEENGADWIVFEDCDCVPNSHLKRDIRGYIETTEFDYIYAPRLYVYGQDFYSKNLGRVPDIWIWKASLHLRTPETNRHWSFPWGSEKQRLNLFPPYFKLHYYAPDKETTLKKLADCRIEVPESLHPAVFGGALIPIPDGWR